MHLFLAALLLSHWLVASDLHVEPADANSAISYYGADSNWALFDSAVSAMRREEPHPAVVVLSGDFLAHHFPRNLAVAEATMTRIVRAFDAAFPNAQFLIVPGNNDDPCGDYRATPGDPYFRYIAHLWAPLVNRHGAAPDFERSFGRTGRYTARLPGGVRAIALDSVSWSIVYRPCSGAESGAQPELQWFEQTMRGLPSNSRAIVFLHIPPGVDAHSTLVTHRLLLVPFWAAGDAERFAHVLSTRARNVAFVLAGHLHADDFRIVGGLPMLIAPSISPVYGSNPAFLRLDVQADGTLRDYTIVDFDEDAQRWETDGTFDGLYGVTSFTAGQLTRLHDRIATDARVRAVWGRTIMSGSGNREIDSGTWRSYWCAQTALPSAYPACAQITSRVEAFSAAVLAGAAAVSAAVVAAVWYAVRRPWRRSNSDV
jgi:sphingomyelin phosphodiesterase acid-like 3